MGLYNRPLVLAHRCKYPGFPENSILSLIEAIKHGADYVEIDCEFTSDKKIINFHGDIKDSKTGREIPINSLTSEEVFKIDLGMGERVPEVEEIFKIVKKTDVKIELDIKDGEVLDYEEYPESNLPDLILKYGLEHQVNINLGVFFPAQYIMENEVYREKGFRFTYNAYNFSEELLKELDKFGFFGVDFHADRLTPENVKLIHDYGFEVQSYPVNDPEVMRALIRADVDVIQTDNMDVLIRVLLEEGY